MKKREWKASCHQLQQVIDVQRGQITELQNNIRNRSFHCGICGFLCATSEEMIAHTKTHVTFTSFCAFCGAEFPQDDKMEGVMAHVLTCDKHLLGIRIRELEVQARERDAYILEQSNVIGKHWERIQELEARYEPVTDLPETEGEIKVDDFIEEL